MFFFFSPPCKKKGDSRASKYISPYKQAGVRACVRGGERKKVELGVMSTTRYCVNSSTIYFKLLKTLAEHSQQQYLINDHK